MVTCTDEPSCSVLSVRERQSNRGTAAPSVMETPPRNWRPTHWAPVPTSDRSEDHLMSPTNMSPINLALILSAVITALALLLMFLWVVISPYPDEWVIAFFMETASTVAASWRKNLRRGLWRYSRSLRGQSRIVFDTRAEAGQMIDHVAALMVCFYSKFDAAIFHFVPRRSEPHPKLSNTANRANMTGKGMASSRSAINPIVRL